MTALNSYPTPMTDAHDNLGYRYETLFAHARDLERKLALCRDALRDISTYRAMQTNSAGRVISADAKDIAIASLDATR